MGATVTPHSPLLQHDNVMMTSGADTPASDAHSTTSSLQAHAGTEGSVTDEQCGTPSVSARGYEPGNDDDEFDDDIVEKC
jgi:hypothetical protein